MSKRSLTSSLLAATIASVSAVPGGAAGAAAPPATSKPAPSGRIPVNGINYYYELHGQGEPLLVLHGGLGSIGMFGPALTALAKGRLVIAVDLQGHGRTELGDRPIDMPAIGDDMAALVRALGFENVDLLGFSMGGDIAVRIAIQHPEVVRRSVFVSAGFARDGFYAEMLPMQEAVNAAMAEQMKETPMYKSYVEIAPHPGDFPRLLDQMGILMRKPYDWSAEVAKLAGPVMLVYGDSDMYRPEHEIKFYQLLGGGLHDAGWMREHLSPNRLAILPNRTHYDIVDAPELISTVLPFLNGETQPTSWDEPVEEKK